MAVEHVRQVLARLPLVMSAYESPAEESLGERLRSAMAPGAQFQTQVWVETVAGSFRLDALLVSAKGRRIGVEVDGKDFHEPRRDLWRTVVILGANGADVIYRVPAGHLKTQLVAVLAGLAQCERDCFRQDVVDQWVEAAIVPIPLEEPEEEEWDDAAESLDDTLRGWQSRRAMWARNVMDDLRASRWDRSRPGWGRYFDFAVKCGVSDLDAIMAMWASSQG